MKNFIAIITGESGDGKTGFVKDMTKILDARQVRYGGILALGYWKNNQRDRFELCDLLTGEKIVFCQRTPVESWEKIVSFYINPQGERFGNDALNIARLKDVELIIIDEIGPFELQGKGWAEAIENILREVSVPMLWVVRQSLVDEVVAHWGAENFAVFNVRESRPEEAVERLLQEHLIE